MKALKAKKSELGLGSIEGRRSSLEQQLHEVELAKYQTEQDLATAEAHLGDLRNQLRDEPERKETSRRMVPNSGADLMQDQLYALKLREKEYRARYSETHPMLLAIQEQVVQAQAVADQESARREVSSDDINIIHQQLALEVRQETSRIAGLKSRRQEIGEQRESVLAALRQLNADEISVAELEREEEVVRDNWIQYSENLEEARIDQQREQNRLSNVSIAQPATLSQKPVSPSKVLVALASLMLAIGGTLGAVLASERMNRTLRTRDQVESTLGVPLVGRIATGAEHLEAWTAH